ncbi:MAG: Adenylate kinase [Parcubacteria group bacterium GW2011_GWA2_56_7]|nr:MAG: Adenylate kinase [Parcubacteria group bacterium GW2011_GWA2_56_7]
MLSGDRRDPFLYTGFMYKILLMGPQGSGKGTQAERLSADLGIPAFGMGQLIREEITRGSKHGKNLERIIMRGDLISDTEAADLLKRRLSSQDTQHGYILDGYPRNIEQYNAFDFDQPTHVLVIDIPREESLRRLSGRLTCDGCNKIGIMSRTLQPGDPCGCGGVWRQRKDDEPSAINNRLTIYEEETAPVIARYEKDGLVHHVDGVGDPGQVSERIRGAL